MKKMLPASDRRDPGPAEALHPVVRPLLGGALHRALEALQRLFPHAEQGRKRKRAPGESELPGDAPDDCLEKHGPAVSMSLFCKFSGAANRPTSCRPRMLLAGRPGHTSHLAPALLHALERFTVHNLDTPALFSVSNTSPEEACLQVFRAAWRAPPSVLYLPHIQQWWDSVGSSVRTSFLGLLGSVPTLSPVLLLATCSVPYDQLDPEVCIQSLFREECGEVHAVGVPTRQERDDFLRDLILNQAAEAPPSTRRAQTQGMEVLPLAAPRQLTEQERLRLEEQEDKVLQALRLYLRHLTDRLVTDRRFQVFKRPVDTTEVMDYLQVIRSPMDLSTLQANVDANRYSTLAEFVLDADLIWRNALSYNPNINPMDRRIRQRAHALNDTMHFFIRDELSEDFERKCEDIKASRVRRGEAPRNTDSTSSTRTLRTLRTLRTQITMTIFIFIHQEQGKRLISSARPSDWKQSGCIEVYASCVKAAFSLLTTRGRLLWLYRSLCFMC
uniref:Bromo domain-containing protein n=1 Tax=Cyclopterus lumpus TaxID=8103 RepID=A0A8C2ZT45_CYCLU